MAALEESAVDDPKTYKQAMKLQDATEWKEACALEVASLIENKVYPVVDRPTHKQVVTSNDLQTYLQIDAANADTSAIPVAQVHAARAPAPGSVSSVAPDPGPAPSAGPAIGPAPNVVIAPSDASAPRVVLAPKTLPISPPLPGPPPV